MHGKIKQDSQPFTNRHPFKPNMTWSITDGRLRHKDVNSKYVQGMWSLLKTTKRRGKEVIGRLRWTFSREGINERYSQYVHFADGDSYCSLQAEGSYCTHPKGNSGCNTCNNHVVNEPYEPTRLGFLIEELVGNYQMLLNALGCFIHGHDLCGCGHAGPESGSMDHECQRCDEQWSVPLY